jgi:putative tryptophan/tyrosine transport system substrate-binding protein
VLVANPIGGKWLELLKDTAPGTARVAVVFDPRNPTQAPYVQGIEASAPSFGVQLTLAAVTVVLACISASISH